MGWVLAAPAHAEPPSLPVASDGTNVWVVSERMTPRGVERVLLHHAPEMGGPHAREVLAFREAPIGMAAAAGRVWLVMAPGDATRPRRETYTVAVVRHPATGVHQYEPPGRMAILPSLSGEGAFGGLACAGDRLLALDGEGRVLALEAIGWTPRPESPRGTAIIPWGKSAAVLVSEPARRAWVVEPDGATAWVSVDEPIGAAPRGVSGAGAPLILAQDAGEAWTVFSLGEGAAARVASVPPDARRWGVVALGDTLLLLEAEPDGGIRARALVAESGEFGASERWSPPASLAGQWILMVLAALLVALLLVGGVLVLNPGRPPREAAPYGLAPMPPVRRGIALAVDLAPGVLTALALGAPWQALLRSPLSSTTGEGALPALWAIGAAVALSGATEAVTGTSLGKWLLGGRVARMAPAGARPALWQVLVRNVLKALVLMVPLAMVFTIWAPGFRGIAEVFSRTGVVRRDRPETRPLKDASADRR
jgi:hypothetical protein